MDFGQLLHTAQKNGKVNKNEVRYYSTKFEPPKKEKKGKELSDNIKKFLARKEAEEKSKAEQENKKRDELLALRAQDKKATRRVNVMLKRTKSANQSVIQDAVDNDNTAVTLAGPMQPDEDDYGYVSQEASAFYNKMMEKYSKMPDEPKFDLTKKKVSTNISNTKDRVKAALEKEREEALLPHRRKRKHKEHREDDDEEGVSYGQPDRPDQQSEAMATPPPPSPPKKHKPAPPPMNFADLLKIAAKKQFEPIVIEKKEKEEEKLLTKKQRKEMEKEREYLQRKEARKQGDGKSVPSSAASSNRIPKIGEKSTKPPSNEKLDKVKTSEQKNSDVRNSKWNSVSYSSAKPSSHPTAKSNPSYSKEDVRRPSTSSLSDRSIPPLDKSRMINSVSPKPSKSSASNAKSSIRDQENHRHNMNNINQNIKDTPKSTLNGKVREVPSKDQIPKKPQPEESQTRRYLPGDIRYKPPVDTKPKQCPPADLKPKSKPISFKDSKPRQLPPNDLKPKQFPPSDLKPKQFPPNSLKPKQFPPNDLKPKQFPPKDLKPKQFPPPDVRRKEFPSKKKPVMVKKGRILDDDSEYDSEMDDFIDDGEPDEDYSRYISEIFGYDKSKYRDVDDDVDNMESTFAQQMKEEVISAKIGIMEDLEDIRMEEQEKKQKALMKKKKK